MRDCPTWRSGEAPGTVPARGLLFDRTVTRVPFFSLGDYESLIHQHVRDAAARIPLHSISKCLVDQPECPQIHNDYKKGEMGHTGHLHNDPSSFISKYGSRQPRFHRCRPALNVRTRCSVPRNRGALYHQARLRELAARYGVNAKTVAKWRRRSSVCDARMGPMEPHSTVLSKEDEALIVAFHWGHKRDGGSWVGKRDFLCCRSHRSPGGRIGLWELGEYQTGRQRRCAPYRHSSPSWP